VHFNAFELHLLANHFSDKSLFYSLVARSLIVSDRFKILAKILQSQFLFFNVAFVRFSFQTNFHYVRVVNNKQIKRKQSKM
jgi:hypothetical protein